MHEKWIGLATILFSLLSFGAIALFVFRKARRQRQELYSETDVVEGVVLRESVEVEADREPAVADLEADPVASTPDPVASTPDPVIAEATSEAVVTEPAVVESAPEVEPAVVESVPEVEPAVVESVPEVDDDSEDREALRAGLQKTNQSFMGKISALFKGRTAIDDSVLDDLEDVLLTADVGVRLVMELVDELRDLVTSKKIGSPDEIRAQLKERLGTALKQGSDGIDPLSAREGEPKVLLFVGVNGVGKTTSIGKIAHRLTQGNKKVALAAGDTFRAAAVEQLKIWGERTGCRVIAGESQADPASVIYNAVQHAVEAKVDFLLADTAGRLHTKTELMDEIKKVSRAAGKALEGAPHEIWLVVDGTTGQNALTQAREFNQALGLSGVVLTKLDGTAKGGVVVAIANELKLPVRFVGVGEQAEDLRPFQAGVFLDALFAPC